MNGDDEFMNRSVNGGHDAKHEVVPAILDGELLDGDGQPVNPATRPVVSASVGARLARWWRYSPRVPVAVKSWTNLGQAARAGVRWLLCSPVWLLRAVGRGLVAAVRAWRRWVRVADYRQAAEDAEKLADKFTDIRALTLFRWKVTGATTGAVLLLGTVAYAVYGWPVVWSVLGVGSLALAIVGRRTDGAPGRKAVLAGPRSLAWTMDPGILVDAFRDAKLIGKDEALRLVERANRQGDGWAITVDLPATRKAADVIKHREALASALAVDEVQLITERVRGKGGHAGRVALWVADDDPYDVAPVPTPLLGVSAWDAWRPVPFGRDARDRAVTLPLVWTSLLVGAIPRQGKTFATRLVVAGLVLDPHTRLYVFDGKGGKDWQAAELVAHRFVCGDNPEHVHAVRDGLAELVAETQARFARMAELDDAVCPESKITPEISRDRSLNMPVTAVVIDEVQVYLEDSEKVAVGGLKTTMGEHIADLLTYLAKKGPAAGIVVILATQRPDSNTIPSRLRAVLGSRFALRVMDWRDSNIILGEQMNVRGFDSSRLLAAHKGVGILRPDGDSDAGAEVLATTVRTYYMPNAEWRTVCERGRELREQGRTLTGHATGSTPALNPVTVPSVTARTEDDESSDDQAAGTEVPEPLASILVYLDRRQNGREFIPSAELADALGMDKNTLGAAMNDHGCTPIRRYVPTGEGENQRVRGYLIADISAAVDRARRGGTSGNGGRR